MSIGAALLLFPFAVAAAIIVFWIVVIGLIATLQFFQGL
jgi:hypothetical protein